MTDKPDISELTEYSDEEEAPITKESKKVPEQKKDLSYTMTLSSFRDFLLKPEILHALVDNGFESPSEVQHEAIPQAILGVDVICQAKSGMGKTAVFVIAILQQDPDPKFTSALILGHTRELAFQISNEFQRFTKYLPDIKISVFYGGVPVQIHRDQLKERKPQIAIGTPGRVSQLIEEGYLDVKHIKHFILDECDKMLDTLSMRRDVQQIFMKTPHDKQVMMFSATMPEEIRKICRKFMKNPLEIYIGDGLKLTLEGLQQYYVDLREEAKNRKLVDLLDALEFNQCIIFVRSVSRASALCKLLEDCNFPSICIHSGMSQEQRIEHYRKFKEFQSRIMVSTNLFGRGVDIPRVNVVFNYDMPDEPDAYLHRVGRAGRFGTKGLAISFISSKQDGEVLNSCQQRFVVEIPPLPDEIDTASYMGC